MKKRSREFSLTDINVICERCSQDIAPLKTFMFESKDMHYAKCVFGTLRRIEIE